MGSSSGGYCLDVTPGTPGALSSASWERSHGCRWQSRQMEKLVSLETPSSHQSAHPKLLCLWTSSSVRWDILGALHATFEFELEFCSLLSSADKSVFTATTLLSSSSSPGPRAGHYHGHPYFADEQTKLGSRRGWKPPLDVGGLLGRTRMDSSLEELQEDQVHGFCSVCFPLESENTSISWPSTSQLKK